jgi:hypothetical protein
MRRLRLVALVDLRFVTAIRLPPLSVAAPVSNKGTMPKMR